MHLRVYTSTSVNTRTCCGARQSRRTLGPKPRRRGAYLGLPFLSEGIPQDGFVERKIGHDGLEPSVLLAQLFELLELTDIEPRVVLPPAVERRLRHRHLAADVDDGRPALRLPQRLEDLLRVNLLLRISWPSHSRECGLAFVCCQNGGRAGLGFGSPGSRPGALTDSSSGRRPIGVKTADRERRPMIRRRWAIAMAIDRRQVGSILLPTLLHKG